MNHSPLSKQVDSARLQRGLVTAVLFLITVFVAFYSVKINSVVLMGILLVLPFALMLISKPQTAFVLAVVLAPANIGVYREIDAAFLMRLLICVTFFVGIVLGQKQWRGAPLIEKKPLLALVGVIILLMVVRGTGLRILGSRTWGGTVYINLFSAIFFFFAVNGLQINRRYIRLAIWWSLAAGAIGSLVNYAGWAATVNTGSVGSTRLTWLTPMANTLLALGFVVFSRKWAWIGGLLMFVALTFTALTGYRSRLMGMIMIIGIYFFFKSRNKVGYVTVVAAAVVLLWGVIIATSPAMPRGMQRAVSFVPGATVDVRTALDAQGSIDWRVEIWGYALERAPEYLLIGRGGTFDVFEAVSQISAADSYGNPWIAFLTHTYHSGPIELLIDYGIIGLLSVLCIHILIFRRMWKLSVRLAPHKTPESRFISYLCASQMWLAISFYAFFGYMIGFASWLVESAIAMVLANNLLRENELEQDEAVAAESN